MNLGIFLPQVLHRRFKCLLGLFQVGVYLLQPAAKPTLKLKARRVVRVDPQGPKRRGGGHLNSARFSGISI